MASYSSNHFLKTLLIGSVIALTACGGGSSGGGDSSPSGPNLSSSSSGSSSSSSSSSSGGSSSSSSSSSGGGSSSSGGQGIDEQLPQVSIAFPPRPNLIAYDSSFLVKGSATDNVQVDSVLVNGVKATTTDGYSTWVAKINLDEKTVNNISVEVIDSAGNANQVATAVQTTAGYESHQCATSAFDQKNNLAFVAFYERLGLWSFDEEDFSLRNIGIDMRDLVFDNSRSILYALDYDKDIYQVDFVSGTYELLSPEGANGIYFQDGGFDLVVDEATGVIYAYTDIETKIFSVDPASGERKLVSGPGMGSGADVPKSVHLAFDQGRLFYLDSTFRAADLIYEVDISTGDRTKLASSQSDEHGEYVFFPSAFAVDALTEKAYVHSNFSDFIEVDLTTGERTFLSEGYDWRAENILVDGGVDKGVVFDRDQARLIIPNCRSGDYFAVDVNTGNRIVLTPSRIGHGADLDFVSGVVFSPAGNSIYTVTGSAQNGAIVRVDRESGNREVISAPTIGNGVAIPVSEGFEISSDGKTLYGGGEGLLYRVDIATGDRTLFSYDSDGNGIEIGWGMDFALDEEANRLVVADYLNSSIVSVSTLTGEKTTLSSSVVGEGPAIVEPRTVAVNTESRLIYIPSGEQILEVDPETGTRRVLIDTSGRSDFSAKWITDLIYEAERARLVGSVGGGSYNLVEIDVATGELLPHALVGIPERPGALAYDKESDLLYGVDIFDAFISVIDPGLDAAAVISR